MSIKRRSRKGPLLFLLGGSFILSFQNCSGFNASGVDNSTHSNGDSGSKSPKGEWDLCPKKNVIISDSFYPVVYGSTQTIKDKFGNSTVIDQGTTLVIKFKVPADHKLKSNTWYFGSMYSASTKIWALSSVACDFSEQNAVKVPAAGGKNAMPIPLVSLSDTGSIQWNVTYGLPGSEAGLIIGQTYYLNVHQLDDAECDAYEKSATGPSYTVCRRCDPYAGGRAVPDGCALDPVRFE